MRGAQARWAVRSVRHRILSQHLQHVEGDQHVVEQQLQVVVHGGFANAAVLLDDQFAELDGDSKHRPVAVRTNAVVVVLLGPRDHIGRELMKDEELVAPVRMIFEKLVQFGGHMIDLLHELVDLRLFIVFVRLDLELGGQQRRVRFALAGDVHQTLLVDQTLFFEGSVLLIQNETVRFLHVALDHRHVGEPVWWLTDW